MSDYIKLTEHADGSCERESISYFDKTNKNNKTGVEYVSHEYLITEGSVFNHNGENYKLNSRGLVMAEAENEKGEKVQLSKDECPSLFQEILVG